MDAIHIKFGQKPFRKQILTHLMKSKILKYSQQFFPHWNGVKKNGNIKNGYRFRRCTIFIKKNRSWRYLEQCWKYSWQCRCQQQCFLGGWQNICPKGAKRTCCNDWHGFCRVGETRRRKTRRCVGYPLWKSLSGRLSPNRLLSYDNYEFDIDFDWNIKACNTAFCVIKNEKLLRYYTDKSIEFMRHTSEQNDRLAYMVFAEQRMLPMCAKKLNMSIMSFSDLNRLF